MTYGQFIPLTIHCNPFTLLNEVNKFEFAQYNPSKPQNPRLGLSITSIDGNMNGIDLESIPEYREKTGLQIHETSFTELTDVYYSSKEVKSIVDPFKKWLGRTHVLNIRKGGYFPPHRDDIGDDEQVSFRVIVPLSNCNPPDLYFIHGNETLHFENGRAYFLNTNLAHSVFSFSDDCMMIVMNIICCEESINSVIKNFYNV